MAFKTRCLEKITIEMITPRLIGRLDIKNKNLIKPINLEGLRIVGDPNKFAKKYYEAVNNHFCSFITFVINYMF